MILAIDNQISPTVVTLLEQHYEVVLYSGHHRWATDEAWVEEALSLGADVFISPDLDIPNILDRLNADARWIEVPQRLRTGQQFDFLIKRIRKLK